MILLKSFYRKGLNIFLYIIIISLSFIFFKIFFAKVLEYKLYLEQKNIVEYNYELYLKENKNIKNSFFEIIEFLENEKAKLIFLNFSNKNFILQALFIKEKNYELISKYDFEVLNSFEIEDKVYSIIEFKRDDDYEN
ncbi:hypothetical protein OF820_07860 [Oceanotoga sp. DSM 15011]|jgi:hypothetical protein|uniref:Uncharacterized protein n=1 Tax=Oceanotoga teriensis TaxID=515440 RepID=A0AA45C6J9_9BACT|nr:MULTISPECIES: hypothetical protein [Oceanotoga]MDN5342024.1 hypothetical protein [Oceanotoga sp.]MDO7976016.1 hypothetical protein [Oceanotoga teriensis]PWJ92056.1 hypothetical protein C7380_11049 [Oceanotoga teriensis]UYO98989.1 hypothetical protein OF820_07860 [Oceanotoga sp. DSM 15011]